MQRINNLYEMIFWVNLLLHTAWCVWLQEETSKKPLWHFWSHSLQQQKKRTEDSLGFLLKVLKKTKTMKQVLQTSLVCVVTRKS